MNLWNGIITVKNLRDGNWFDQEKSRRGRNLQGVHFDFCCITFFHLAFIHLKVDFIDINSPFRLFPLAGMPSNLCKVEYLFATSLGLWKHRAGADTLSTKTAFTDSLHWPYHANDAFITARWVIMMQLTSVCLFKFWGLFLWATLMEP